jgi:hypothetical protein
MSASGEKHGGEEIGEDEIKGLAPAQLDAAREPGRGLHLIVVEFEARGERRAQGKITIDQKHAGHVELVLPEVKKANT